MHLLKQNYLLTHLIKQKSANTLNKKKLSAFKSDDTKPSVDAADKTMLIC